jgi:5-methylcytosine-specific restriction endonuclease McrA
VASRRTWVEARAKVVREGRCRNCGTTNGIEAAHLVPRSRVNANGGAEDPRNILPLCGDFANGCHRAYDEHRLTIRPLLTPEEIAYMVHLVGQGETDRRIDKEPRHAHL